MCYGALKHGNGQLPCETVLCEQTEKSAAGETGHDPSAKNWQFKQKLRFVALICINIKSARMYLM